VVQRAIGRRRSIGRLARLAVGAVTFVAGLSVLAPAALAARPANDDFIAPETLTALSGLVIGTTKQATKQSGEPDHAGNAGGASVWYRWVADAAGSVTLSTEAGFDTLLAVYTGSTLTTLTEVAANDDTDGFQTSALAFDAVPGTEYRIAVDGYGGAVGPFRLQWSQHPPNDDLEQARPIVGGEGSVEGSTTGATAEAGEPFHAGASSITSIWYRWTAPTGGMTRFSTAGSTAVVGSDRAPLDTVLAVYTGGSFDQLELVTENDDFGALSSEVSFPAVEGTVYSIAVSGYGTMTGDVVLSWFPGAILLGTLGRDVLVGTPGRDIIDGGPGPDVLRGGDGDDLVFGGDGADVLRGGAGNDVLEGRDGVRGNDRLVGGAGLDVCNADPRDRRAGCP
jgi:Ca2+-binding RTX toxin-like protein